MVHVLHRDSEPAIDQIVEGLQRHNRRVTALGSTHPEHIAELLGSEMDRLIVAGGDGMVHHAAQQLVGSPTPVGIIPVGTGNDIARALGVPSSVDAAVTVALGPAGHLDAIQITDDNNQRSYAVSVLTAGFSGTVTAAANRIRRVGGQLKYTAATLQCLPKLERYTLDGPDGERRSVSLVAVGNTRFFGGGMAICPNADPCDGEMDVVFVDAVHPLHLATVLPAAFAGQHVRSRRVHQQRHGRFTATIDAPWWADGEELPQRGPVEIASVPDALVIAAPATMGR